MRKIAFVSLLCLCALPMATQACKLTGNSFHVTQSNAGKVTFVNSSPSGSSSLQGQASIGPGVYGDFSGSLAGNTFTVTVHWKTGSGSTGVYEWTVDDSGNIMGHTHEADKPPNTGADLTGRADYCT
jgi:hypothetical protein